MSDSGPFRRVKLGSFSASTRVADDCFWVGAASFEERCMGSIVELQHGRVRIEGGLVLDYGSELSPALEGEVRKKIHRQALVDSMSYAHVERLATYRYGALLNVLADMEPELKGGRFAGMPVVVDVTCMTKIHAMALMYWFATTLAVEELTIAYTVPRNYGSPVRNVWGKGSWIQTLLAPLDFFPDETLTEYIGLAVLGHEGDRLRLALGQVELLGGLVMITESGDIRRTLTSEIQNQWLINEIASGRRPDLRLERCSLVDMHCVQNLTSEMIERAKESKARLVIMPYGPKPLILGVTAAALSQYPLGSWYIYPIPKSYDIELSAGTGNTYWASLTNG